MSYWLSESIPNQYIVAFKQHTPEDVCQQHCEWAQVYVDAEASVVGAESGEPELTGFGELFSFDTPARVCGGSFDENTKNEIEAREEVDYVEPGLVAYASTNATLKVCAERIRTPSPLSTRQVQLHRAAVPRLSWTPKPPDRLLYLSRPGGRNLCNWGLLTTKRIRKWKVEEYPYFT